MNEVDGMRQEDYSKDWVMHNRERFVILREEDESGQVMVMKMTNECGQEAEQRSGYGDKQLHEQESSGCVEAWIAVSGGDCNIVSCSNRVWSER